MRLPSGRRASRRGRSSDKTRPTNWAMLRAAPSRPSSEKRASVLNTRPLRSIQMSSGPLIMISETLSSSRKASTGFKNARSDSLYMDMAHTRLTQIRCASMATKKVKVHRFEKKKAVTEEKKADSKTLPFEVDPKKLEESLNALKDQVVKLAKKGRYTKVRFKWRGKQLLPDLPLAAVA